MGVKWFRTGLRGLSGALVGWKQIALGGVSTGSGGRPFLGVDTAANDVPALGCLVRWKCVGWRCSPLDGFVKEVGALGAGLSGLT